MRARAKESRVQQAINLLGRALAEPLRHERPGHERRVAADEQVDVAERERLVVLSCELLRSKPGRTLAGARGRRSRRRRRGAGGPSSRRLDVVRLLAAEATLLRQLNISTISPRPAASNASGGARETCGSSARRASRARGSGRAGLGEATQRRIAADRADGTCALRPEGRARGVNHHRDRAEESEPRRSVRLPIETTPATAPASEGAAA